MRKRDATWGHAQWAQLWATLLSACHGHLLGLESLSPEAFYTNALLHHRPLTPDGLTPQPFYTGNPLHQKPFTREEFYTKDVLYHNPFTPQNFYLHERASCTRTNLHKPFTPETFYTKGGFLQIQAWRWMRIVSYVSCNPGWCFKFVSPLELWSFSVFLSSPLLSSPLLSSSPLLWGWVVR